jgi:hypothetical protein
MARFYEGDRVRLGALRGGIVVRHLGQLRVKFLGAATLLWLDGVVVDDGTDGRIYPNTWDACEHCGNPSPTPECLNCRRRAEAQAEAFDRRTTAAEKRHARPSFGIHVAGPVERVERRTFQRCLRCGADLAAYVGGENTEPVGMFPAGALVERTYLVGLVRPRDPQAKPNCTPATAIRRSA